MRRRGSENRSRRRRSRGGGSLASLSALGVVPPVATSPLTTRVLGLPWWAWAGVAVGGGLTAWAVLAATKASAMPLTPSQQTAFKAALPSHAQPYAEVILRVADEQGMDPFAIFALGDRESLWGTSDYYKQQAGDWTPRLRNASKVAASPHIYRRTAPGAAPDAKGNVQVMPADGLGWGRGLMQIDWEQQFAWVSKGLWRDSYENVKYGASYLKTLIGIFSSQNGLAPIAAGGSVNVSASYAAWIGKLQNRPDLKGGIYKDPRPLTGTALQAAAVAAYNTGPGNVIRNLALGMRAEASTTGGDYTGDTLNRQAKVIAAYMAAGGTMPA